VLSSSDYLCSHFLSAGTNHPKEVLQSEFQLSVLARYKHHLAMTKEIMLSSICHHKARQNDTTLRAHQKLVHCTSKPNVLSPVGLMVLQTVNVHINKQIVTGLAQET